MPLSLDELRFCASVTVQANFFQWTPRQVRFVLDWGAEIAYKVERGAGFIQPQETAQVVQQFQMVASGEALVIFNEDKSDFSLMDVQKNRAITQALQRQIMSILESGAVTL